jgi:quaternary ammonium compound-resistance protein SugE
VLPWIVLALSGILEAVWATALGKSAGFTKVVPTVIFGVGIVASMTGLAFALRSIPIGTGYAVWVGIGATLTVLYAMISGAETMSIIKIVLVLRLIGCVVGLELVSAGGHKGGMSRASTVGLW